MNNMPHFSLDDPRKIALAEIVLTYDVESAMREKHVAIFHSSYGAGYEEHDRWTVVGYEVGDNETVTEARDRIHNFMYFEDDADEIRSVMDVEREMWSTLRTQLELGR